MGRLCRYAAMLLLLLCCTFAGAGFSASADDGIEDDLGLWVPITLTIPVDEREKLSVWVYAEPRLDDNLTGMQQMILMSGVSVQVRQHLSLEAGYGWFPTFTDDQGMRGEHRLMEQATISQRYGRLSATLRNRLEQRFIEGTDGVGVRERMRLQLEYPIQDSPWYVTGYDELLVSLNSVDNGPRAGYDQNRAYLGLGRYLGEQRRASVDGGYQLVHSNKRSGRDLFRHLILVRVSVRLR